MFRAHGLCSLLLKHSSCLTTQTFVQPPAPRFILCSLNVSYVVSRHKIPYHTVLQYDAKKLIDITS